MSARELQRVAVRMLHDPAFRDAVICNPEVALSGVDLNDAERRMLQASDPRAWQVDAQRAWRVLTTLLSEFAVSVAALREPPHTHEAFFRTAHFHQAIQVRRSLSEAFGAWLEERELGRSARAMLTLDRAFAAVRRGRRALSLALPEGSLGAWEAATTLLHKGGDPVAALVRGARPRLALGRGSEHVLVEAAGASLIDEALHRVLALAAAGADEAALRAAIADGGATADEVDEILADLVNDGLVATP